MIFIPEKAQFINKLVTMLAFALIFMIVILQVSDNVLTKSLMMLLIISLLAVGASFLLFMKTLYYKIEEDILTIGSIFRFTDIHIKLEKIVFFTERITLLNQSGIAGMLSKRFSVGKGYIE
ncbi:MAG TPA: hypothetical protein DHM90_12600 [Clostridiaceae bacterium]|nr:hypothetical protein [Clostridiaceae bacterium]